MYVFVWFLFTYLKDRDLLPRCLQPVGVGPGHVRELKMQSGPVVEDLACLTIACRPGWNLGWSQGLGLGTLTWEVGVFKCKTKLLSLSMTSHILKNIFYLAGTMVIQLSLWLQWQHPIWMLVQGMAAPLLMQLPDNGLGRQWKSAKFLCPCIHVGDSRSLWLWTGQCVIEPRWDICLYPSLSEILSSNKKNTINI